MLDGWTQSDVIETVRFCWEVVASIGVVAFGWMNRRDKDALAIMATKDDLAKHKEAHEEDHRELEKRLAEGDVRFTRIETTLDHMPTKDDISDLMKQLQTITNDISSLKTDVKSLAVQVHQLVQNELEHRT